jgi:hypothetical protein
MLFAVEKQLGLYRQRIEELFGRHPDHDLFGSLPGAGPKLAPSAAVRNRRRPDALRGGPARPTVFGGHRAGDPPHR